MSTFSNEELAERRMLVRPIVEAAFSIQGKLLSPEKLEQHAEHWEAAFGHVGTPQLLDLYRVGLEKQCRTAEQFLAEWEMAVEAGFRAAQHRRTLAARKTRPTPPARIPVFISESWTRANNKR